MTRRAGRALSLDRYADSPWATRRGLHRHRAHVVAGARAEGKPMRVAPDRDLTRAGMAGLDIRARSGAGAAETRRQICFQLSQSTRGREVA